MYYLGGSSTYQGLYADDYYNFERGSTVPSGNATKWVGKVGIMYPSDYTYAADLSVCQKAGHDYDDASCKDNNWLFTGTVEWTIAPCSGRVSHAFDVWSSGDVSYSYAYFALGVRPVVYLKSGVNLGGGTGQENDPYQLVTNG